MPSKLTDLDKLRKAVADKKRPLEPRLILEWKWRDELDLSPFRHGVWDALDAADEAELALMARAFPDEVRAIRLFRTTWIGQQLVDEGLLVA